MKTYCKEVNITSDEHLGYAFDVFAKANRKRREFRAFFEMGREGVIEWARGMIESRALTLPPITYFERTEPTNGKTRLIGRTSAKQQYLDYVCVLALEPLFTAKVGYHQCASVKGKGQSHARRYIERWVRQPKSRYYVKLDIKKYYPSVDRDVLFTMLERDIDNPPLMWLIESLINTHRAGINIGSYLSQYLANYYLSGAYRFVCSLFRERVSRRTGEAKSEKLVDHTLTYMDDWLLIGHDKANLKSAVRKLVRYLEKMLHVSVKPWKVCDIDAEPIDMCGFVFRRGCTTIRPAIFIRLRRAVLRVKRMGFVTPHAAGRITSYWGYLKYTSTRRFRKNSNYCGMFETCRKVISLQAKGEGNGKDLQLRGTGSNQILSAA